MNPVLEDFQQQNKEILELVEQDLKSVKTGRAKPALIEDVKVQAYDTSMLIRELASITVPDPQQIIVSPWDKGLLEPIEKALATAELNLSPVVDSEIIRIKIPSLTQETRKELVKLVNQKLESARAMLRQVRNEAKSKIEERKGEVDVSEDDIHHDLEELQKVTDETMAELDERSQTKEKELMTI